VEYFGVKMSNDDASQILGSSYMSYVLLVIQIQYHLSLSC